MAITTRGLREMFVDGDIRAAQRDMDMEVAQMRAMRDQFRWQSQAMMRPQFSTWGGGVAEPSEGEKVFAMEEIKNITKSATPIAVKDEVVVKEKVAQLKELGFDSLHEHVAGIAEKAMRENLIAARGYTKITEAAYEKAAERISSKSNGGLRLELTPVNRYLGQHNDGGSTALSLPPVEVLGKMAEAKKEGLFDSFGIIHVCKVQDPILVGQIKGSSDMYFIAEWGDDISLAEMLG